MFVSSPAISRICVGGGGGWYFLQGMMDGQGRWGAEHLHVVVRKKNKPKEELADFSPPLCKVEKRFALHPIYLPAILLEKSSEFLSF